MPKGGIVYLTSFEMNRLRALINGDVAFGTVGDHALLSHLAYADAGHSGFQPALGFTAENAANKGAASGYAPLGADSKVPAANLPAGATSDHAALSHLAYADAGHTGFQPALGFTAENVANKGAVSGYCGLDANSKVATANLGGAGADNTKFLRGDQTWQVPSGASFGAGVDVAYDGSNFTASGSMTWTVEEADQIQLRYLLVGQFMFVSFRIETSSIGGSLSNILYIKIPDGKTAAAYAIAFARCDQSTTHGVGFCSAVAGDTRIAIFKGDISNWASNTNSTFVQGSIWFEIT